MGWAKDLHEECKRLTKHVMPEYEEQEATPMTQSKTSQLYEHIIDVLKEHGISEHKRHEMHMDPISLYEDAGCKDLKVCMGVDKAFDSALEEVGA